MIETIAIIFFLVGDLFFLSTAIGILRFPDFYTRIHAASKGDTLSSLLILLGFAVYNLHDLSYSSVLVSLKIVFIILFIFITSPTASHALVEAGYTTGAKHWEKDDNNT